MKVNKAKYLTATVELEDGLGLARDEELVREALGVCAPGGLR